MLDLQLRLGPRLLLLLPLVSGLFPAAVAQRLPAETSQAVATGWRINFDESGSNPVIADSVLYVGSADGAVYALNPKTGETKWRFQTGENLSPATSGSQVITVPRGTSTADQMVAGMDAVERQIKQGIRRVDMTPAVENGTIFIGSGDRSFYAIDAATGKKKWSYLAGSGMASSNNTSLPVPAPVLSNGTVYFVTDEGLHALDALTGKRKWLFETRAQKGPVLDGGVIFLTAYTGLDASKKSSLYAINSESGKAEWATSVDGRDITAPVTAKGLSFFAVEDNSFLSSSLSDRVTLYEINAVNGQVKWKFGANKKYGTPRLLIIGDTIYFCTDKNLSAIELGTGRQLWSLSLIHI